jgi:hypothetical protein
MKHQRVEAKELEPTEPLEQNERMSLNRIYEGRVSNVEMKNPDKATAKEKPWLLFHHSAEIAAQLTEQIPSLRKQVDQELIRRGKLSKEDRKKMPKSPELADYERLRNEQRKEWQSVLQKHHERFQDAVNYCFAVFAAMVPDKCDHKYWREYRAIVERNWPRHVGRKGSWPTPFAAVCLAARLKADASFQEFRATIFKLTGSQATESQRFAALTDLFRAVDKITQAAGATEDALAGEARKLFGQEFVTLAAQKMGVKNKVVKGAQKDKAASLIENVRAGGSLSWEDVFAFKTHPGGKPWTTEQAAKKLRASLKGLITNLGAADAKAAKAETTARSEKSRSDLAEKRKQIAKLLSDLAVGQKTFEEWLADKATKLPADEPVRTGRGAERLKAAMLFAVCPKAAGFREAFLHFNQTTADTERPATDPCYEARHAGGIERPVFPQFLDLWCGRQNDPSVGHGVWPHFEKAAFIEAFNKIGQFHITGRDFDDRLAEAEATISAVNREMDRNPKSKLHDVKNITEQLAEGIVGEDGLERRYVIRDRTLKQWSRIRERWRVVLKENPAVTAKDLIVEKNVLQKKLREKFGSAALFEKLAEHRTLWEGNEADVLERWADYEEALETKAHLEKGQKFTPAHPELSPRYFRWSEGDKSGKTGNRKHLPWQGMTGQIPDMPKPFAVLVEAFDFERKSKMKLLLNFSAPRLLRNELRKAGERMDATNPDLVSLPPALRAVVDNLKLQSDRGCYKFR